MSVMNIDHIISLVLIFTMIVIAKYLRWNQMRKLGEQWQKLPQEKWTVENAIIQSNSKPVVPPRLPVITH